MKQIINLIKQSKSVAVFGHQSPDGDCLGSISAISFLIESFGINVDAFIDDDIPPRLTFLEYDNINKKDFDLSNYDLLITVDVASDRLLGKYKDIFLNFSKTIVIDHHKNRKLQGTLVTYVDNKKASCSEIIFELINTAKINITKDIATKLYMGVVDDTACFLHDNTTSSTHYVGAKLLELGADLHRINYNIIKKIPRKTFEIRQLLNSQIVFDGQLTYIVISGKFMMKHNFTKVDIGDYVNMLVNLENTKIAFTVVEKQKNVFSVSLRSISGYDVSHIASALGGGGHSQASGFEIREDFKDNLDKLIKLCKDEIEQVSNV